MNRRCFRWLILLLPGLAFSQPASFEDVYLFQAFFRDTPITGGPYGDIGLQRNEYDFFNSLAVGAQAGLRVVPNLELGGALAFINWDPDFGPGQSGISDLRVSDRSKGWSGPGTDISAGGYSTLPIGREKICPSTFDLGGFAALRHVENDRWVVSGHGGLDFYETPHPFGGSSRRTAFGLSGGANYSTARQPILARECRFITGRDVSMLCGSVDYLSAPARRPPVWRDRIGAGQRPPRCFVGLQPSPVVLPRMKARRPGETSKWMWPGTISAVTFHDPGRL